MSRLGWRLRPSSPRSPARSCPPLLRPYHGGGAGNARRLTIYTYICTYICTYIYTYIYTYVYTHIYTYICTYIYTYIYIDVRTHRHRHICIPIYTHTHIHIHIYVGIHTYAPVNPSQPRSDVSTAPVCDVCGKQLRSMQGLQQHLRDKHAQG